MRRESYSEFLKDYDAFRKSYAPFLKSYEKYLIQVEKENPYYTYNPVLRRVEYHEK